MQLVSPVSLLGIILYHIVSYHHCFVLLARYSVLTTRALSQLEKGLEISS